MPKKVPHTITRIPAFHEIKKHTKTNDNDEPSTKKIRVEKKKVVNTNTGYNSTIITDTKSNAFSLFPEIVTSIKSWFKKLSAYQKRKKTPTYTVPETTSRKGVIQRATSKTGTIFIALCDLHEKDEQKLEINEQPPNINNNSSDGHNESLINAAKKVAEEAGFFRRLFGCNIL